MSKEIKYDLQITAKNYDGALEGGKLAHTCSVKLEGFAARLDQMTAIPSKYLNTFSSLLVLMMAFLIMVDIIARHLFNYPIPGTIELEQFMLAIAVFLSLAYALINNDHIIIELFTSKFSTQTRNYTESAFSLASILLFIIIAWQCALRAIYSFQDQEIGEVSGVPLYPVIAMVAFGSILMVLVLLKIFVRSQAGLLQTASKPWLSCFSVFAAVGILVATPWLLKHFSIEIPPLIVGCLLVVVLLVFMLMGFRIAFAMGTLGFLGTWYLKSGTISLAVVRIAVYDSVSDYFLCVIPFFILMGMFCFKSGISKAAYNAAYKWFGHMPGGVAVSTIAGCAGFASICGDSMATAATMGAVSLPEMKKYKYNDALATGTLAAGGTLGILIPPSIGFIIYGLIAEASVAKLFMAGIIPGIMLAGLFSLTIYIRCKINPSLGPAGPKVSFNEKIKSLRDIWPIVILFCVVIGGIYSGFMTPTEAGGIGAVGALLAGLFSRDGLSRDGFFAALDKTMRMTAMIFAILIGVSIMGFFVVVTEIPLRLADFIVALEVSRYVILVIILGLYLALGMVMNIIPMIMLTLPILFPTVIALGFDPIWFGVITVIMMEMGQITPPVGINVFVISGVAKDVPMMTIFKGIMPFILAEIMIIIIITLFPGIVMWLPNMMDTLPSIGG